MDDLGGPQETSRWQPPRGRRMSPVVLPYRQRIGIGLVMIVLLIIFGGLVVGVFDRVP
jgi:hypothetical protein